MDPVASGLTILDTVRKAVKLARKLYNAPKELEELQVEVDTFTSVLHDVAANVVDIQQTSRSVDAAIGAAKACLLQLQQLIQYGLVRQVPDGTKTRRTAWLRKVGAVHELLERLGECRADLILALDCDTAVTVRRSQAKVVALGESVRRNHTEITEDLTLFRDGSTRAHVEVLGRLDGLHRSSEDACRALLDAQGLHHSRIESNLSNFVDSLSVQLLAGTTEMGVPRHAGCLPASNSPHSSPCQVSRTSAAVFEAAHATANSSNSQTYMRNRNASYAEIIRSLCTGTTAASYGGFREQRPRLPKRVIDIGQDNDTVRLHECSPEETAEYIALSYRWPGVARIITTQDTLAARKEGIPWNLFPEIMQSAIRVARMLGIQYLWIDALCILQDSVSDWMQESGTMQDVYGGSTLTLVLDSAAPMTSTTMHSLLEAPGAHSTAGDVHVADQAPATAVYESYASVKRDIDAPEWSERGWMLQEALLSRRRLYVTESRAVLDSDDGLLPILGRSSNSDLQLLPHPVTAMQRRCGLPQLQRASSDDALDTWLTAVEMYSDRRLASYSDKLIAIAGLAHRFSSKLGRYICGLWLDQDFISTLAWRPKESSERPPTYTAPSWSWASTVGAIQFAPVRSLTARAVLKDYHVSFLSRTEFGNVRYAWLKVKGRFLEFDLEYYDDESGQQLLHLRCPKGTLVVETDAAKDVELNMEISCLEIASDQDGNLINLVLARPWRSKAWKRVAITTLYRRRGEHRWFEDVAEGTFVIK